MLITACHVATELNTCSGLLRLTKWLIGDDASAAEIRRRQIVLIMPNNNPDALAKDGGSDVYMCWSFDGVVEPDKHPEAVALQRVIDRNKPEVHADVHGVWFAQQTMWESTGISWACGLSRSIWGADRPALTWATSRLASPTTAVSRPAVRIPSAGPTRLRPRWC